RADRLVEARPAAAGVELRAAAEQLSATRTAGVEAGAFLVEEFTGPGSLGRSLAQHRVCVGGELLAPFGFALAHGVGHGILLGPGASIVSPPRWCGAAAADMRAVRLQTCSETSRNGIARSSPSRLRGRDTAA